MWCTALQASLDFVDAAMEEDGSNRKELLEQQFKHVLSIFQRCAADSGEATTCLKMLKNPAVPFTAEQSKQLRLHISTHGAPSMIEEPRTSTRKVTKT